MTMALQEKAKQNKTQKLSPAEIEKVEDIVADRLAEILIMQLEYEKEQKLKGTKRHKEN